MSYNKTVIVTQKKSPIGRQSYQKKTLWLDSKNIYNDHVLNKSIAACVIAHKHKVKNMTREEAEKYTRELFLALSEDAINKNKISLKQLVLESQTPGGTNAFVLKELKKKKFYKVQQKVLNSIFKKF